MANRQIIHLIIKDKNGIVLEEDVRALSSYNEVGIFDVLPLHTNFISLIRKKLVLHTDKENKEMDIGIGLIRVADDLIHVYLGLPDPEAEAEMENSKNALPKSKSI